MLHTCIVLQSLILVARAGGEEISIASFNIRIFSNGSRDDGELELIADRLQQLLLI